jgi:hypothetical protein
VKTIDIRLVVPDDYHEHDITDNIADILPRRATIHVLRNDGFGNLLPDPKSHREGRL